MSVDPEEPPPEGLGDILGRWLADPDWHPETAKPCAAQDSFEPRIRMFAQAIGEDPDELLRLARGTTPLARLVRLLMGEQSPAARVSSDEKLYTLYIQLKREGFTGAARRTEMAKRLNKQTIEAEAIKQAVARFKRHLAGLPPVASIEDALTQSTSKILKPRGRKPKPR